jgi:hypothetical protein
MEWHNKKAVGKQVVIQGKTGLKRKGKGRCKRTCKGRPYPHGGRAWFLCCIWGGNRMQSGGVRSL